MRKCLLGSLVFAVLNACPAMSADVVVMGQRPVATGVFSWTSWYVGGFAGAAWGNNANTTDPCVIPSGICWLSPFGGETLSYPLKTTAIGGATAGYNYQIPGSAIVFGLETEFGALRLKGSSTFAPVSPIGFIGFSSNLVASTTVGNWYNATTGRLGWAWDNVLFYGKGGFALSTIESTIVDTTGLLAGTGKKDIFGWAWGAGVEYVFAPRWSVKAEYLWLGLNHSLGVCAATNPRISFVGNTFCSLTNVEAVQTFKVGVNYLLDVGPVYDRY
jgi:outer membrane immunogenic protein